MRHVCFLYMIVVAGFIADRMAVNNPGVYLPLGIIFLCGAYVGAEIKATWEYFTKTEEERKNERSNTH